jgi:hypothetical protein
MKKIPFTLLSWALLLIAAVLCFPAGQAVAADPGTAPNVLPMFGIAGLIDMFDTRTMLQAVEQMKRPFNFLRDTFFPAATPVETETVDVDIIKGKRRMAPFCSPLTEGKVVEHLGYSTSTIKPGYVKPFMITTAGDLLKRLPGQTLYAGNQTIEGRAQIKLGQDLATLMDMVDRREEWMAAMALDLGKITMKIKGETSDKTVTVDFLMAGNHKITLAGAALWSASTSDPIGDLRAWASQIRQDSGINPVAVVMGTDAATAFIANPTVQKTMNMLKVNMGQINPQMLPNGVSYLGNISAPGLSVDVYTYEEWFLDEDAGTESPMVPAKKVWMGSPKTANRTLHAVIQDIEAIEEGSAAVSRFPKSWVPKNPSARHLMVQSAPLVAMLQPDAFVSAQVLA